MIINYRIAKPTQELYKQQPFPKKIKDNSPEINLGIVFPLQNHFRGHVEWTSTN